MNDDGLLGEKRDLVEETEVADSQHALANEAEKILSLMPQADRRLLQVAVNHRNREDRELLATYWALSECSYETFRSAVALSEIILSFGSVFLGRAELPHAARLTKYGLSFESMNKDVSAQYFIARMSEHARIPFPAAQCFWNGLWEAMLEGKIAIDGFRHETIPPRIDATTPLEPTIRIMKENDVECPRCAGK